MRSIWTSELAQRAKNLPANARDASSIPGLVRSPGGGHGNPLHYSCLENPMAGRHWGRRRETIRQKWTQRWTRCFSKPRNTKEGPGNTRGSDQVTSESVGRFTRVRPFATPRIIVPPGSSGSGILQARTLEWAALPFSRGIFLTRGSNVCLLR